MPSGYIDGITSSGLIEGWAFDNEKWLEPLQVEIVDWENKQIAAGLANLYRKDLAESTIGFGWCHFRLRVNRPVETLKVMEMKLLLMNTNIVLHSSKDIKFNDRSPYCVNDVTELLNSDPTIVNILDQIETFEEIFNSFIRAKGVDAFVRAAYVYVLGRSIDEEGILLYGRLIRQNRLSPYAMLRTLAESAEFRERPRSLMAPTEPGFPFRAGY